MPSLSGRLFRFIARAAGNVNPNIVKEKKKQVVKDLRSMEPLFRHYIPPIGYSFKKIDVEGVPTEVFAPKKNKSDKAVLVIHGGAYISRMMFYYRLSNKSYSKASGGGTVVHFDYRCAPEHVYPAALDDTEKVWNWLISQGYKEENIVTVGDSAGGHLTMDLLLRLRDSGRRMPNASVLMSPWIDMTASGDSYVYNYKVDPVFGIKGVTPSKEEVRELLAQSELYMWLGDNDRNDPYISPALAEYDKSFPALFVTVGGDEMLLSEAQTLVKKFRDAGLEADLLVGEGMFHAYPVYRIFPEAREAHRQISAFIAKRLGTGS
ncbi:MAG: alpha/beta hydrolase [Clostridia bacterium]|nr:alpha/beta hydrolase [Clostridia bacterium]